MNGWKRSNRAQPVGSGATLKVVQTHLSARSGVEMYEASLASGDRALKRGAFARNFQQRATSKAADFGEKGLSDRPKLRVPDPDDPSGTPKLTEALPSLVSFRWPPPMRGERSR